MNAQVPVVLFLMQMYKTQSNIPLHLKKNNLCIVVSPLLIIVAVTKVFVSGGYKNIRYKSIVTKVSVGEFSCSLENLEHNLVPISCGELRQCRVPVET